MKKLSLLLALALGFVLSGCGSGSPAPPMITFTPTGAQAIDGGQSLNLTAAVSNDATSKGVTWTLSGTTCTGAACGTLSNVTTTSVTYTPPALAAAVRAPLASSPSASHSPQHTNQVAAASTSLVVTITATLVADTTKSNSVMVTVTLPPTITTTSLNAGTEGTPYSQTIASSGGAGTLNFAIGSGALPAGLTLSSAGVISGTPTGPNTTAQFTVKVTDSSTVAPLSATSQNLSIAINLPPAPSIVTTSLPNGVQGTPYSQTISATAGLAPYSFTFTGTLPAGLTLSSAGVLSGTPTAFGTANFTVKVTDSSNPAQTATQALSIKINAAPVSITTTSLPNGVVNAGYNATLQASGGAPPLTWSLAAGSALPTGLLLSSTGAITGTPTTAGTTNFTVQAADSSVPQQTATKALSITVNPVLSITTPSLPNGVTNTAYSATLASSGGVAPVTWSVTGGVLPTGLTLNASTGAITGSPTAAGPFNFTVQAADSGTPQQKVTKALSITIVQQLAITNTSLPTGAVTSLYAVTLQTSGGTPTVSWAMTLGSLPPGLTLNSASGAISGTPTTATGSPFTFTVQATDSGTPQQIVTKQFTIVINPVLAITTVSPMPSGTVGTAYNQTVQTNGGGIAPITWSMTLGALPGGLSLNTTNGAITGTPNAAGTFNFTVKAADSGTPQQTSSKALTIQISTAPLSVATTGLPDGVVGQNYSNAILQSGGGNPPVTWSIVGTGTLPAGLLLNASTGAITGTPTTAGTSTFTVKATDSTSPTAQTATKQLSIRVNTVLSVTTTTLPNGIVNNSYSTTLQSNGGATPITWSITGGSLPPGLTLVQSTGVISGTPNTTNGSPFSFTVQAADSTSPTAQTASANLSITVTVAPLVITTTSLPSGLINSNYNQTLNFTGGTNPVTWALTGGTLLPAGLVLNPANGNISGTPTTAGTSNFSVKATDSTAPTPQTATANLSITINSAACNTGSESLLKGNYAFVLKGFDNGTGAGETSPEPVLVGGVLTFNGTPNGGLITTGTIDINGNSTANATSGVLTNTGISGTYSVGSDHRGCMAITTSAGTQNYRFSLGNISAGVASTGHVIAFDAAGPFTSGVLRKQDTNAFSTAVVTGNYAFGVSSAQNTNPSVGGGKFAAAGVLNFSTGVVSSGEVDFNMNGSPDNGAIGTSFPASPISILSGSYTINASDGRGTLIFTPSGNSTPVHAVLYVVSATDVLILGSDDQTVNSAFAGEAMRQSSATFAANPLSGAYIGYQSGLSTNTAGASRATLLLLNASGTGISGSQLRNDAGGFQAKNLTGITYSVDPTGRMTITGGTQQPVFYLVSANQAFEVSADSSVDSGFFQSQTGSSFTNASLNGLFAFGTVDPEDANGGANSGTATFTPATTTISIIEDKSGNGSLNADQTQSFSYSIDPNGLVHIPTGCTISATTTTCQTVLLVVSPTKAVILDTSSTNPKIQVADQ